MERKFSEKAQQNFKTALNANDWTPVLTSDNAQISYNIFEEHFNSLFDIFFPLVKKRVDKNRFPIQPWFTMGMLVSRATLKNLYQTKLQNNSEIHENVYKQYRNINNRVVRLSKKMYFEKQFKKNLFNLKSTWKLLFEVIKRKPKKILKVLMLF